MSSASDDEADKTALQVEGILELSGSDEVTSSFAEIDSREAQEKPCLAHSNSNENENGRNERGPLTSKSDPQSDIIDERARLERLGGLSLCYDPDIGSFAETASYQAQGRSSGMSFEIRNGFEPGKKCDPTLVATGNSEDSSSRFVSIETGGTLQSIEVQYEENNDLSHIDCWPCNICQGVDPDSASENNDAEVYLVRADSGLGDNRGQFSSFCSMFWRFARAQLHSVWKFTVIESSWLFLLLLGVFSSFVAWLIDEAVAMIATTKLTLADKSDSFFFMFLVLSVTSSLLVFGALQITSRQSPQAAGSGIPELRSILAGFKIRNYLGIRTLIVKVLGLIMAQSAGLIVGKEGPFVHISSILAHQMMRLPLFHNIRESPALYKQLLGAACAVGVSSTFGAPIGGVLFSIEVTSSLFQTSQYWKSFFAVVWGVVVFREFSYLGQSRDHVTSLFATTFEPIPYSIFEIPVYICISAICGYLAGIFVNIFQQVSHFRRKQNGILLNTYSFAFLVVLLGNMTYWFGDFMSNSLNSNIDDFLRSEPLSNSTHSDSWERPSVYLNLLLFALLKSVLTILAIVLPIPCGVFTPVFAIGAAFGRFVGEILQNIGFNNIKPAGYAIVGAASFTAGATGTVSTAVIIFELTNQLSYMLPVLLSVLVGVSTARIVGPNIYDAISIAKNLPHYPQFTKQRSYSLPVRQIMDSRVTLLPRFAKKQHIQEALEHVRCSDPDPFYLFAIVTSLDQPYYLGSMTFKSLLAVEKLYALSEDELSIDILDHCNVDYSTLAIPQWTPLSDASNYFDIHKRRCIFVVNHGKVIGRLNIKDILRRVDENEL